MRKTVHVYCFDFDRTLTENQTNLKYCYDPPELLPNEVFEENSERWKYIQTKNIKPKIAEMFRAIWAAEDIIAIVTFCENRTVVEEHLKVAGLTEGEITKVIIKTWPWGNQKNKNEETKNPLVNEVINNIGLRLISGLTFVDDSVSNCNAIITVFNELNLPGSIIHVNNLAEKGENDTVQPGHKFIIEIIESAAQVKTHDKEKLFTVFGKNTALNEETKRPCLIM
jgi:hypothetical protein